MKKFILSILLPLLIPVICFLYVWNVGGDGHVKLPAYFVIDSIANSQDADVVKDTFYHRAKDFSFENQLGDSNSVNTTFNKKIVVLNTFIASDTTTSLQLNKNMQFLQKVYRKKDDSIAFLSVSIEQPTISTESLRNYANSLKANHDKWNFGIANKSALINYLHKELIVPDFDTNLVNNCNKFILLDRDRNIRGYYNALDTFQIRNCADDISLLMLEKKRNKKKK